MKLLSFEAVGRQRYGVKLGDGALDLLAARSHLGDDKTSNALPPTLLQLLRQETYGIDAIRRLSDRAQKIIARDGTTRLLQQGVYFPLDQIKLRTPIPHQSRMFSMRGNNPILLRLDNLPLPQHPFLTPRYHGRLIGHQETMVLRSVDGEIGWGAEFMVVLGRGGKDIPEVQASQHILGYTAINDMNGGAFRTIAPDLTPAAFVYSNLAASEIMDESGAPPEVPPNGYTPRDEHYAGKFYGTWSMPQPVGPWIVTADEIPNPYDLVVHSRESGIVCDTVTTASMLRRFEDIIAFMSRFMTLKAGDMISSGALGWHTIPGRKHYPSGSNLEIEIEGIGVLRNPIEDYRDEEQL